MPVKKSPSTGIFISNDAGAMQAEGENQEEGGRGRERKKEG